MIKQKTDIITNKILKGRLSSLHTDVEDAVSYLLDFGYYMVECPYCGEVNDAEVDATILSCVTCNKMFEIESIA